MPKSKYISHKWYFILGDKMYSSHILQEVLDYRRKLKCTDAEIQRIDYDVTPYA